MANTDTNWTGPWRVESRLSWGVKGQGTTFYVVRDFIDQHGVQSRAVMPKKFRKEANAIAACDKANALPSSPSPY